MRHFASPEFWELYQTLPRRVRRQADSNHRKLKANPFHPSVHLKQVGPYWSAGVGLSYRALAVRDGDDLVWFWIGPHTEYDRLIR